jgi:hypothetical protein
VVPRANTTSASGHGAADAVGTVADCIADIATAAPAVLAAILNFPTGKS